MRAAVLLDERRRMNLTETSAHKSFGGRTKHFTHPSAVLDCAMKFAIYLPPQCASGQKVPVLYWLSGLTCTDENFMQKAGAQRVAAELGIAIVAPDTSPRGPDVADDDAYDLGQGAGFYVNAVREPWSRHYHMYDYILGELPQLIEANFPVTGKRSISGHSMGGHGALVLALRNPGQYQSASAFSPIANPADCPWGRKAFSAYLGDDQTKWAEYDASKLMRDPKNAVPMLVDQGLGDEFLEEQLKPETLEASAGVSGNPLALNRRDGYDHSYNFIASFIDDHLRFHAAHLDR